MNLKKSDLLRNNLIAIISLLVGVFTLLMYIKQTNLLTKQTNILIEQNKAATWPYLFIGKNMVNPTDSITHFKILITNQGNGLAIIEKVVLRLDGVELRSWSDFYREMKVSFTNLVHYNSPIRNKVLMPGEELSVIGWDNAELLTFMYDRFMNLEMEICYRSVLGEYWTVKRTSFHESKSSDDIMFYEDGCRISATTYFRE